MRRRLTSRTAVLAAVTVVMVAGLLAGCGGDKADATPVALAPASKAGPDPFTDTVQVGPAVSLPGNVEAVSASVREELEPDPRTGGLIAKGTTPGLYGGTGDTKACDPEKLVEYLDGNPAKAKAWAGVIGIEPDGIEDYVAGLTPIVLTSDTLVMNHGFRDGKATAIRSVLQAGTAVMVDRTGVPRVKCNCGNPLGKAGAGDLTDAKTDGSPWELYAPGQVVSVTPADSDGTFTITDIETGDPIEIPVGGTKPTLEPKTTGTTTPRSSTPTTTAAPATTTTAAPSSGPNAALRAIDWKNRTYESPCAGFDSVTVANGEFADPSGFGFVSVGEVVYGDVASTPGEEAMVPVQCGQGTALSANGAISVFTLQGGEPVLVGEPVPSMAAPEAIGGHLVTEDDDFVAGDPACCPSVHTRRTWTYAGGAWTPDPPLTGHGPAG